MARALRCGILLLALVALAACAPARNTGSATSPTPSASPTSVPTIGTTPTPAAPTATPTPAMAGTGGCQPSQLSLSTGAHNAGAGTVQEVFIFTNTSQSSCTLFGYPGMQMLNGGKPVTTNVVRTSGPESTVTVAPSATASFMAQWHDQTGYTNPCPTSQQVEVTPPNTTSQLTTTAAIVACPGGTINVTAVTAGSNGGQ